MDILAKLLTNRTIILMLGLVIGLIWDGGAAWTEPLTLPVLAIIMTLTTMSVGSGEPRSFRGFLGPALIGTAMNYLVLGGVTLLLSHYCISDPDLRAGFVLIAAVPPAVAVIPFTYLLGGDCTFSLAGTVGGYLAALVIMPLMAVAYFGAGFVSPLKLLLITSELVFLPLVVGHILSRVGIARFLDPLKGPITNWGFSLFTYTVVGLNRDMFLYRPLSLLPTAFVVVISTFVLGWLIEALCRRMPRISSQTITSLVLLGTLKNYGIAGGLALALFGKTVASPATVSAVCMIVYIIWLEWKLGRRGRTASGTMDSTN